ncbi:TAXI family TRAP transporter solute-binding subunit [Azospirillum sp. ST 5-10]|uniref:TAXI family TRAP transporter solute-binding subunit n=1 Tax=unclassified Azospirillum TaxID=2630922 RepID=UPI003F49FC9B
MIDRRTLSRWARPLAAAWCLAAAFTVAPTAARAADVNISAGSSGGTFYVAGVAIGKVLKDSMPDVGLVNILPGGATGNIMAVAQKKAQLGFTFAFNSVDAVAGNPPFKQKLEVQQVASMFPFYAQWITLDESIRTLTDLKGRRVNVGARGQASAQIAELILKQYGLDFDDMNVQQLNFADATNQLRDGQLDVVFWTADVPFAPFLDLATTGKLRFLPMDRDKAQALNAANPGLQVAVIPANTYPGQTEPVPTIATQTNIVAHKDADQEFLYHVAKAMVENWEKLQASAPMFARVPVETAAVDVGIPYAPGALRYFEEKGLATSAR